MARPKATNVEYFPCYCKDGKTLYILESRWGNNGYAFFYKLWKRLGDADFHYIDLRPSDNWEYFRAKMGVSDTETQAIMDKLAEMGVIDIELWSKRVVWSDSFIQSIGDVWEKRKQLIPQKPLFLVQKPAFQEQIEAETGISGIHNPQSKVKESKVNNTPISPTKPEQKISLQNNHFVNIPEGLIAKWHEVAPGINIQDEIKKAELWLLAHPEKRRSKWTAFLSNWMVRAQDHFLKYGGNGNGRRQPDRPGGSGNLEISQPKEWEGDELPEISDEERKRNLDKFKTILKGVEP